MHRIRNGREIARISTFPGNQNSICDQSAVCFFGTLAAKRKISRGFNRTARAEHESHSSTALRDDGCEKCFRKRHDQSGSAAPSWF